MYLPKSPQTLFPVSCHFSTNLSPFVYMAYKPQVWASLGLKTFFSGRPYVHLKQAFSLVNLFCHFNLQPSGWNIREYRKGFSPSAAIGLSEWCVHQLNIFLFFFFSLASQSGIWESYFPDQESDLYPRYWKHGVLTAGPPGKPQELAEWYRWDEHLGYSEQARPHLGLC